MTTPTTDAPEPTGSFADLDLRPELLEALAALGYEEPTPIQREAIPPLLEGTDLLGMAATGTGKTAAFALPILHRLPADPRPTEPSALVLVPTRELAMQVSEALHRYGRALGARILPVYGGQPIVRQLKALSRGVDVVVATPGRAIDHLSRGSLQLGNLTMVVLDEADEMLDMGFAEDIEAILSEAPEDRQTVLFSATMPPRIDGMARRHLRDPLRIKIAAEEPEAGAGPLVEQRAHVVPRAQKAAALCRVLDLESPEAALVFCRTRHEVDSLTETLNGRGYRAEALHGGMSQEQRDRVMARLRAGTAELLIATDVAARGLDIDQLTHVVNHDVPSAPAAYVHRIGSVGRAGREGVAITLAEPREHRMLETIQRVTGTRIAITPVPSVADLRASKLEQTRAALAERIDEGDLGEMRSLVQSLAEEHDLMEVALAAVALVHERNAGDDDEEEIADATPRGGPRGDRGDRPGAGGGGKRRSGGPPAPGTARIFIGAGRAVGVRPGDLVGAIANETSLTGKQIGAIDIAPKFSLVEVPEHAADEVVSALRSSTIKGRKATVRRDQRPVR
jgi:ATP-dependent RNA helicase DeaD